MGSTRRGFLGALAGLPVLVPLVKAEPEVFVDPQPGPPGPITPAKFHDPALLVWKDGRYERVYGGKPLGPVLYRNRHGPLWPLAPRGMERVEFRHNINRSALFSAPGCRPGEALPIYEEV